MESDSRQFHVVFFVQGEGACAGCDGVGGKTMADGEPRFVDEIAGLAAFVFLHGGGQGQRFQKLAAVFRQRFRLCKSGLRFADLRFAVGRKEL